MRKLVSLMLLLLCLVGVALPGFAERMQVGLLSFEVPDEVMVTRISDHVLQIESERYYYTATLYYIDYSKYPEYFERIQADAPWVQERHYCNALEIVFGDKWEELHMALSERYNIDAQGNVTSYFYTFYRDKDGNFVHPFFYNDKGGNLIKVESIDDLEGRSSIQGHDGLGMATQFVATWLYEKEGYLLHYQSDEGKGYFDPYSDSSFQDGYNDDMKVLLGSISLTGAEENVPAAAPVAEAAASSATEEAAEPSAEASEKLVIVTGDSAKIRTEASISGGLVKTAKKGDTFPYVKESGDWYVIDVDGKTGYIHKGVSAIK